MKRIVIVATAVMALATAGPAAAHDRGWHRGDWHGGHWSHWRHHDWDRGFGGIGLYFGPDVFGFSFTGGAGYPWRWGGLSYGAGFAVPYGRPYYEDGAYGRGGCQNVWTIDYERGRRAVLGAVRCFDRDGGSYIVPESRHFIRWY